MDVRALRRAARARLAAVRAWATWTPRRAGTLAGVCVAVLLVSPVAAGVTRSALSGRPGAAAAGGTSGPAASPAASRPVVPQPSPDAGTPLVTASPSGANDEDAPVTQQHQDGAVAAARRFAELWLAGAFVTDRTRWSATMTDVADPSLLPFLQATPASAIPRTSITGVVPRLVAPGYGAVRVTFADRTGTDLEMSETGVTWRVTQYLPSTTP